MSKVSPMATACEPSGVCGSESRKLRSGVAVWQKSKDETASSESNGLPGGPPGPDSQFAASLTLNPLSRACGGESGRLAEIERRDSFL